MSTATAVAHPNIALVKYWGKRDLGLNLPAVSSLSMTVDTFETRTAVTWGADHDEVVLDGTPADDRATARVLAFLDRLDAQRPPCRVESHNTFPTGAGLASSASAFAALALAASAAKGDRDPDRTALSALARQGSGSACRSLWGGFVVWRKGHRADGTDSVGAPLLDASVWDLRLVVGVVSTAKKAVGSTAGMERSRASSPLYDTWVSQAEADVDAGVQAVSTRDLAALGRVMEASTFKMHAVMQTSDPPLMYWQPATVAALHAVWALRAEGVPAWVTMDAGPQVKVLCAAEHAPAVAEALRPHVQAVHQLGQGGPAWIVPS